jgi:hypothetical protein
MLTTTLQRKKSIKRTAKMPALEISQWKNYHFYLKQTNKSIRVIRTRKTTPINKEAVTIKPVKVSTTTKIIIIIIIIIFFIIYLPNQQLQGQLQKQQH